MGVMNFADKVEDFNEVHFQNQFVKSLNSNQELSMNPKALHSCIIKIFCGGGGGQGW